MFLITWNIVGSSQNSCFIWPVKTSILQKVRRLETSIGRVITSLSEFLELSKYMYLVLFAWRKGRATWWRALKCYPKSVWHRCNSHREFFPPPTQETCPMESLHFVGNRTEHRDCRTSYVLSLKNYLQFIGQIGR